MSRASALRGTDRRGAKKKKVPAGNNATQHLCRETAHNEENTNEKRPQGELQPETMAPQHLVPTSHGVIPTRDENTKTRKKKKEKKKQRALTCRKTAPRSLLLVDGRPNERPSLMACQSSPSPGSSVLVATSYTVKPRLATMAGVSSNRADQKEAWGGDARGKRGGS